MNSKPCILVTGGAGFIGANFVHQCLTETGSKIVNLDKLTYAGNLESLNAWANDSRHIFIHGDIGDRRLVASLLERHHPGAIVNFAAESHVDRSISAPDEFIRTNVVATFNLLQEARHFWEKRNPDAQSRFRFLHVSTDEVYGSLKKDDPPFTETTPYAPNSPYSASKASSDHLVRAYFHTYGLPTLTTNCSNNYGPFQFPEKLIPLVIHSALNGKPIPVYGDGSNVRDWLYVTDHCRAIRAVLEQGCPGEVYNIGGNSEKTNLEVVATICRILDEVCPSDDRKSYRGLVQFVTDRPGHDRRYAIDASKIKRATGWVPAETFTGGIRKTVNWYLENTRWVANVTTGAYQNWIEANYRSR